MMSLTQEQRVARALCVADSDAKPCEFFDRNGRIHCNNNNCAIFKMARAAIAAMQPEEHDNA